MVDDNKQTMGRDLLQRLEREIVIGDGAMGTYIYAKGIPLHKSFDELNLTHPHLIRTIHREYIDAGAELIETNTFTANAIRLRRFGLDQRVEEINRKAAEIAREVAGENVMVAGSVGPIGRKTEDGDEVTEEEWKEAFTRQIGALKEGGCDAIILETFLDSDELLCALKIAKRTASIPVICQMVLSDELKTYAGGSGVEAIRRLEQAGADVIGANCGRGPSETLKVLERLAGVTSAKLSAFPNAGMPEYVNGRYMYLSTPDYLANIARKLVNAGANIVGGCCGTTPNDIRVIAQKLTGARPIPRRRPSPEAVVVDVKPEAPKPPKRTFLDRSRDRVITCVELDPPRGMDFEKIVNGAKRLKRAGLDAVTLGDNPLAIVRMGNIGLAHLLEREGIQTIVHLSCRDRNLIGLQSALMEADLLGITSILVVTGDPAKVGDQPGASSVYDLNSFELLKLIKDMNGGVNYAGKSIKRPTNILAGCAFNPNVREWKFQFRRLEKKIAAGARFALTQPYYDVEKIGDLYRQLHSAFPGFPVLFGVLPLMSAKNAEFLNYEVPGISIPEPVLNRMRATTEENGAETGLDIARELIDAALEYARGVYIIPPFGRVSVAEELVKHVVRRTRRRPTRKTKNER